MVPLHAFRSYRVHSKADSANESFNRVIPIADGINGPPMNLPVGNAAIGSVVLLLNVKSTIDLVTSQGAFVLEFHHILQRLGFYLALLSRSEY
jgi:hypothetical protein